MSGVDGCWLSEPMLAHPLPYTSYNPRCYEAVCRDIAVVWERC